MHASIAPFRSRISEARMIFVSARSARYYAIEFVCACVCVCVKHSGRLIRAVRLRTGRKTKMAAFYRVKRNCLFDFG